MFGWSLIHQGVLKAIQREEDEAVLALVRLERLERFRNPVVSSLTVFLSSAYATLICLVRIRCDGIHTSFASLASSSSLHRQLEKVNQHALHPLTHRWSRKRSDRSRFRISSQGSQTHNTQMMVTLWMYSRVVLYRHSVHRYLARRDQHHKRSCDSAQRTDTNLWLDVEESTRLLHQENPEADFMQLYTTYALQWSYSPLHALPLKCSVHGSAPMHSQALCIVPSNRVVLVPSTSTVHSI